MLWISDLSIQDPYYVLPVLMGASMVIQQKIMPTTMDPTQAKMMLLLPVFMTFCIRHLSCRSGVVLVDKQRLDDYPAVCDGSIHFQAINLFSSPSRDE